MENTDVMNNEVIEAAEEVIEVLHKENNRFITGIKITAGAGLGMIAGVVLYKYVARPVYAKIKAKIKQKKEAEGQTVILDENGNVIAEVE